MQKWEWTWVSLHAVCWECVWRMRKKEEERVIKPKRVQPEASDMRKGMFYRRGE
jgi:hypothetical protein